MKRNRNRNHRKRGVVIVMLALGTPFFFGLAGLAVDTIFLYSVKARLVTAVDACALAAARSIGKGQTDMNRIVDLMFDSNFPEEMLLAVDRGHTAPVITAFPGQGRREVSLTAHVVVPTTFMKLFGWDTLRVEAEATATRRDVNVMLVLDRSGSLDRAAGSNPGPTAFDDLKEASKVFVDKFDETTDFLGLVSFGSGSHVDFTPANYFKTPVEGVIDDLYSDNSGTNAPDGLWRGYQELVTLNDANALNVLVFFTDGVSTHYSGDFETNSVPPGGCQNTEVPGVIGTPTSPGADWAIGLTVIDPGPPPVYADQFDWVSGCGFSKKDVRDRIPLMPLTDSHGTSITGWKSIPYWSSGKPTTRGLNIKPIAENLTINTAGRIRTDPNLRITVYSIGLGGEPGGYPADHELMRRVANDRDAATYDKNEPTGMYVYAPSPAMLRQAFTKVASEIFRLIQ